MDTRLQTILECAEKLMSLTGSSAIFVHRLPSDEACALPGATHRVNINTDNAPYTYREVNINRSGRYAITLFSEQQPATDEEIVAFIRAKRDAK